MPVLDDVTLPSLGLDRTEVELVRSDPLWSHAYECLAAELARAVAGAAIEHVGSTSVTGLRAKPILDVALGVARPDGGELVARLEPLGLEYRGDAGGDGGLLFVLENRPAHRIAHVHAVEHGGPAWLGYLAFRDRLRRDAVARDRYERLKAELAARFPHDRASYTAGKHVFIEALVAEEL